MSEIYTPEPVDIPEKPLKNPQKAILKKTGCLSFH
jgi:hypothetical protein